MSSWRFPRSTGPRSSTWAAARSLISASAPRTATLLRGRGLTVIPTPMTEFEKLEGCVTCLSVRMR